MQKKSDLPVYFLHLLTLNGFAIVQPVLDVLGGSTEFFVARGSHQTDLVVLVAVLVFGLPLILLTGYKLITKLFTPALALTHYLVVMIFSVVIFLPVLKNSDLNGGWLAPAATGLGFLFAFAYRRYRGMRMFVSALSPASLIFAGLFLFGPISQELGPAQQTAATNKPLPKASDTPVVMLIFDELAVSALMDANRDIDESVFPNFKRLANHAHWYRNTSTVAGSTTLAVPAVLTGKYPQEFVTQSFKNYPHTLFRLLANSHRMNVYESTTSLCAPALCPHGNKHAPSTAARITLLLADVSAVFAHIVAPESMRSNLPVINMTWDNYWQLGESLAYQRHNYGGRLSQMAHFIDSIKAQDTTGLHFMHVNFPHVPYQYLPSGNRYQGEWTLPSLDFSTNRWSGNRWLITQAYQRYLLQLAAADLMLGRLLDRLQSEKLFDKTMLIVLADHGVSFLPNSGRRDAPPFRVLERDILPVPLFIKYPNQNNAGVSDENVETIDIVPTIADVLNIPAFPGTDGRSLLGSEPLRPEKRAFHGYKDFRRYTPALDGEAKYATLRWKQGIFANASGVDGLFRIGKQRHLVGSRTASLPVGRHEGLAIQLDMPALYAAVDPHSGFVPAQVSGSLQLNPPQTKPELAIAVNGVIRAVTQAYRASGRYLFAAMVPETAFDTGQNRVSVYLLAHASDDAVKLLTGARQPVAHTGAGSWTLGTDTLSNGETQLAIDKTGLKGKLEYAILDGGTVEFFGWALDVAGHDVADKIIIFDNGKSVYANVTSMPRGEGTLYKVPDALLTGFQFIIPASVLNIHNASDIRLFAVSKNGYASELDYFAAYRWRKNSGQ